MVPGPCLSKSVRKELLPVSIRPPAALPEERAHVVDQIGPEEEEVVRDADDRDELPHAGERLRHHEQDADVEQRDRIDAIRLCLHPDGQTGSQQRSDQYFRLACEMTQNRRDVMVMRSDAFGTWAIRVLK